MTIIHAAFITFLYYDTCRPRQTTVFFLREGTECMIVELPVP